MLYVGSSDQEWSLARLLYPETKKNFLNDFSERRPVLIRGEVDKFRDLIDKNSFLEALHTVPNLRAAFHDATRSQMLNIRDITADRVNALYEAGATICAS